MPCATNAFRSHQQMERQPEVGKVIALRAIVFIINVGTAGNANIIRDVRLQQRLFVAIKLELVRCGCWRNYRGFIIFEAMDEHRGILRPVFRLPGIDCHAGADPLILLRNKKLALLTQM